MKQYTEAELAFKILRMIKYHNIYNPVSSKYIESQFKISGSRLRELINVMRKEGIPIGSNSNGYYFARTYEEIEPVVTSFRKHALDRIETANKMEKYFIRRPLTLFEDDL